MIKITEFAGLIPKVATRNKSPNFAVVAENVDLEKGTLKPWREPLKIADVDNGTGQSLFMTDCCIAVGECDTRFAKTGVLCDEIVVATDLMDYPVYAKTNTCPFEWTKLAFDCDLSAPTFTVDVAIDEDFHMENRSYIYTLVNDMGWESQPSYPSVWQRTNTLGQCTVSGLPTGQTVRVYRSAVSLDFGAEQPEEVEAVYLMVGETTTGTLIDNVKIAGDACVTDEYDAPPDDLREIQSWREGRLAGLSGNVFLMSERSLPYAWNRKFAVTFYDKAIALVCTNRLGYVLTDGKPVVLELRGDCEDGEMPIVVNEIPETLPVISRQSATEYMGGVVYASHNGLVWLNGKEATLITQQHYTPEQWQKLHPHTMKGIVHQGHYYGTTETTTIRFRLPDGVYSREDKYGLTTLSIRPNAWFRSDDDRLYFTLDDGVYQWNQGNNEMTMTWRGNLNTLPGITRFSAYKIIADERGNKIKHFADTREIQDYTHKANSPTRLPVGHHGIDWQVEITGTAEVFEYHLATSIRDLAVK